MGIYKAICQRCDVNLIRIHLLLEVLEHNSNLSGPEENDKRGLFIGDMVLSIGE